MRTLSINDCGTAHEEQLLDIYNGLIDKEKESTGKELTSLEKSKIELQVAEAYQSILTICKDGGQISRALEILKEKIPTMSVDEISKVAVDKVNEVHNTNLQNVKNSEGNSVVGAVVAGQLLNESLKEPKPIILSNVWEGLNTSEIAEKYEQTSEKAEAGDKNAQCTKGLINYALNYLRTVDNDEPKGKDAMVLILIKNLSDTKDPSALEVAKKLSEKYKFDVFSVDENGNHILNQEVIKDMYKERVAKSNSKKAENIPSLLETKKDYFIEISKESPKTYEENLEKMDRKKIITEFAKKYYQYIKAGEFDKAEEFVRQNQDVAKELLNENVKQFGKAQILGRKDYMEYLQKMNTNLSKSVAEISREEKAIAAKNVKVEDVITSVNPKPLIDSNSNKRTNNEENDREL